LGQPNTSLAARVRPTSTATASAQRRRSRARPAKGSTPAGTQRRWSRVWSQCRATAHPLHTRFTKRIGESISEATMRPNPKVVADRNGIVVEVTEGQPQVRKTGERLGQVGPEVGPTSAFSSSIPTGMHGPTCILYILYNCFLGQPKPFSPQAYSNGFFRGGAWFDNAGKRWGSNAQKWPGPHRAFSFWDQVRKTPSWPRSWPNFSIF
jgi:hypothetical protein